MEIIKSTSTILLFLIMANLTAQPLAFPGAEGFGRFTTGGRGGEVIIVDKLTDSEKDTEKGSLRWAVKQNTPRTIVFAVSGTIALQSPLEIKYGNVTIAGQTAPGGGICIKNFPLSIEADNVIIRFMRFRCGNDKLQSSAQDAINCKNQKSIIIDHCSMSWSIDETASFYDNKDFTLQWCIISESLYNAGHPKGKHGYGGIWGGHGASFHHNLLSCHTSRNPRFCGSRYSGRPDLELVDFRNNVIFNWGYQSAYGGEEGNHNIVNNYYKPGPGTKEGKVRFRILDLDLFFFNPRVQPDTLWAGRFYITGDFVEVSPETSADNWKYGVQGASEEEKMHSRIDTPFHFASVTTHTPEEAYRLVLKNAGAFMPARDAVDQRILREVVSGTCEYGGSWGVNTGIIDNQNSVGGWPELRSLPALTDKDKDGMPDEWEQIHNLKPNNPSDRNHYTLDGNYTNLEIYLNSLIK
ncbi:MAG: pectate lyase [Bacteroidales bacterium]|nr:pectate lyase [Bacteroidales bacterium]